jgi:tetratricopeptide (TPR) repeat protein
MATTGKPVNRFTWQHGAVLLMGLLVFVLLLFADKTNLDDETGAALGGRAGDGGKTEAVGGANRSLTADWMESLPADETNGGLAQLRTSLDAEQDLSRRQELYHQIVEGYRKAGRPDLAAVYAAALAAEVPEAKNYVVAGALFRNATSLPFAQLDSNLFRRLSNEAIGHDESALELDPDNEDAMLELGLAMVESRIPGNSMTGIFKIREVAERNPNNTEAIFHLGKFSLDTNQDEKAVQRFRQILAVKPEDVRAKYYLGVAEKRLGNSAEFKRLMSEVAIQAQDQNLAALAKEALNRNQ